MKITLRKANAIQMELQNLISKIEPVIQIELNDFDDARVVLSEARTRSLNLENRVKTLFDAAYELREVIGSKNSEVGVSSLVTELAKTNALISRYTKFSEHKNPVKDYSVYEQILERQRTQPAAYYGSEKYVPVIATEDIQQYSDLVSKLKKRKSEINDQLLELNIATQIELSSKVEEVLKEENFL